VEEVAEELGVCLADELFELQKAPKPPFVAFAMTAHLGAATQRRTFGLNWMVSGKGCSADALAASSLHARAEAHAVVVRLGLRRGGELITPPLSYQFRKTTYDFINA